MAELTTIRTQQIDKLLDGLIEDWSELPEIADEFQDWNSADQIDFIAEWQHTNVLIRRLERYLNASDPTPEQQARFAELQAIMVKNRPFLDQIYGPE